jgi:hypothetical protein
VKKVREVGLSLLIVLLCSLLGQAQQSVATATDVIVPPLVNFSGVLSDGNGKPLTGIVGVTFYLYKEQEGGAPLWLEIQNVTPNSSGHYTVMLGSTTSQGIPANIFASGEAHWLGVQVSGQAEQPRVLLVSAPYALKAGDAETLGGLPASAFVLAAPQNGAASSTAAQSVTGQSVSPATSTDVTTSGGTVNYLPLWDTTSDIVSSVLFQSGTGSTAKIGINTATPASTLDIKGGSTVRGTLSLPATGAATATAGKNSQPLTLAASAYNSSTPAAVSQTFQWQAEPAGNDTATPSATLNLLFGAGTAKPSETGLNIASDGQITFATGQTFPTVTGNETVTGNISSDGSVSATTSFDIGGTPFAFGSIPNGNAFPGFAGNSTMTGKFNLASGWQALNYNTTGSYNTASGPYALYSNTTGSSNTADGYQALASNTTASLNTASGDYALYSNTTGYQNTASGGSALYSNTAGYENTASGYQALAYSTGNSNTATGWRALYSNTTGSNNTALGYAANLGAGNLTNATAIGANATVAESNALVLGSGANVGIGTAAPRSILEAAVSVAEGLGPTITLTNAGGGTGASTSLDFNSYAPATSGTYNPAARILVQDVGSFSDNILFQSNIPGAADNGLQTNMEIFSGGGAQAWGFNAPKGSGVSQGGDAIYALGGSGDLSLSPSFGADGVVGYGGAGVDNGTVGGDGYGGLFVGGANPQGFGGGGDGIYAKAGSGLAGFFDGDVTVDGTLSATTKDFKIDHPLDPANKYLVHASVESSEMMNIYTGNVTTDGEGVAIVQLPDWFEALNTDFRYQLTVIGQFARAIVSREVANHQFSIKTDKPSVKVSWQITGVREDAYAKAHPLVPEQAKDARERGHYIHPQLYGAPEQQSIEWARHPEMMKKLQEVRAQQLAAVQWQRTTTRAAVEPLAVPPGPRTIQPPLRPGPAQQQPAPKK